MSKWWSVSWITGLPSAACICVQIIMLLATQHLASKRDAFNSNSYLTITIFKVEDKIARGVDTASIT